MGRIALSLLLLIIVSAVGASYYLDKSEKPVEVEKKELSVMLYLCESDKVTQLPLEDYVTGVVAAEMPASFPMEALKAQAVLARTYIIRRLNAGGILNCKHPGADIDNDPRHGQGWISRAQMKERWGSLGYFQNYHKIRRAVEATRGEIVTFQGELIDPLYHASCGGLGTEDAGEVWKYDIPYLKGVECPYDADPRQLREQVVAFSKVKKAFGFDIKKIMTNTGNMKNELFSVVERTSSGRPKVLRVGEKTYPAVVVRDMLGLRSTYFMYALEKDQIRFTTRGNGHAVGMCQYGAKGLAEHGYNYEQIIKHYYTGVNLSKS